MKIVDFLILLPGVLNDTLDVALPWVAVAVFIGINVWFSIKSKKKINEKKMDGREFSTQLIILILVEITIGLLFWILPALVFKIVPWEKLQDGLRWVIFSAIIYFIASVYGHENGENRWKISTIGHLAILWLGFIIHRWVGILFISVPLIVIYYLALYRLAQVILPTSNPEDRDEKVKRFIILAAFTWGIQFPIMVVADHAWKKPEVRIPGDFTRDFKVPGLLWTKSHQVAAITGGTQFKRVDGPGVVFTGKLERPLQIVDLRLQLRTNEIDVISKDGIHFKARVFAAFRMDPETWEKDTYSGLRSINPVLRGANIPSYTKGSFPYSHLRVQAAMGITSSKSPPSDTSIFWDQWALGVVENEARKIISQKTLDELWRPQDDQNLVNALDVIARELKENITFTLRTAGILVYASRIVNFRFEDDDMTLEKSISRRQIESWGTVWEQKRKGMLAEAEAESERMQQEARAYAESILLNSIAEGLQKTKDLDPRLPRYVIAMRLLSSVESFVGKKTGNENVADKRVSELHNYLRDWQSQFFPDDDKEK